MITKYDIGDCLQIVNYYDEVFCSDIVEINITKNDIIYKLSNKEAVSETPKDNSYNRIIGKIGHISNE